MIKKINTFKYSFKLDHRVQIFKTPTTSLRPIFFHRDHNQRPEPFFKFVPIFKIFKFVSEVSEVSPQI